VDQITELEQRPYAFEARLDRFMADLGELVAVAGLRRNAGGNIALSTVTRSGSGASIAILREKSADSVGTEGVSRSLIRNTMVF
jgi:hypothetical protein